LTFSRRFPAQLTPNRLTRALAARTRPYADLTATNPTAVGLAFPPGRGFASLAAPAVADYVPDPKGLQSAREAVAAAYARHGVAADPERLFLSASSSESYAWLFKLLCDPGDGVLVPSPSYPLLDALAELEGVSVHRYALTAEDGWGFHASEVEAALDRASRRIGAVVLVNPNNPTGSGVARRELERLLDLARTRGFAVISDEVFLDYRFADGPDDVRVAAAEASEVPVFSLGGLSKSAALPQMKLGWILCGGPFDAVEPRLAWIADTFLSVGAPVQVALPDLLEAGAGAADAVRERVQLNLDALQRAFPAGGATTVSPFRGGWSAVLRVPATEPEEELVLRLLNDADVLVQPGHFYEFPFEAFLVLSLLPVPELYRAGVRRLAAALHAR